MAWHIAWGGSGTCSFGGLNAIQTPILGSYWSTPTTTRTKSCPRCRPPSRVLTTWQALPEDSTGLCAWWCLPGFGVPPGTETTTPRPSLTRNPSPRATTFAQNGEGLKISLRWRVQPIFPSCVGRDGFPPICPCPHEGGYTRYEVLVWLTLRGKKFVACKIATTYGEDLSLEGGVVLYNTGILM